MDAGDPQFVLLLRENLRFGRVAHGLAADDHVFQARARREVAQDESGVRHLAATLVIDAKIQIVTGPRKSPRLRIVGRGCSNARVQDACFGLLVQSARPFLCSLPPDGIAVPAATHRRTRALYGAQSRAPKPIHPLSNRGATADSGSAATVGLRSVFGRIVAVAGIRETSAFRRVHEAVSGPRRDFRK